MNKVNLLLLKIPFCSYPDSGLKDDNFRTKASFRPIPSLALATLCEFLDIHKKFDFKMRAIDVNIEAYQKPGEIINVSRYSELLAQAIKMSHYDVLALSAMFVFNVKWVEKTIELSRRYHPNAKIILGGGYATLFPERCLEKHDIDYVIIGEGEAALLHILNELYGYEDKILQEKFPFESYGYKNIKGEVVIVQRKAGFLQGEDIPAASWKYLDIKKYFDNSGNSTLPVEASRGCPYQCTYCCTYLSWGRKIRYKPVEKLINELLEIQKDFSPKMFHFVDDNLSFSKEWILDFLNRFIDMRMPVKIEVSNFSIKHLDEEILDLFIKSGLTRVALAVETGSKEIQGKIKKRLDFDRIRSVVELIKSKNLQVHICWMLGFPGETLEQIKQTFGFAKHLRAHSNQFLTVLPYPGTELFHDAKKMDILVFDESDLDKFDNRKCEYLKPNGWNYNQLQELIYDINIELNFLNNPLLEKDMDKMQKFLENILLRLPEHIIARIVLGYIFKSKNQIKESAEQYEKTVSFFKREDLGKTFFKYLSQDHYIINDFNEYTKGQRGFF